MRGKAAGLSVSPTRTGITPAYAGKRGTSRCPQSHTQDHPRLCGEKKAYYAVLIQKIGSPPPMRGKVVDSVGQPIARRITPAYAGKSSGLKKRNKKCRDHPRLCGEK